MGYKSLATHWAEAIDRTPWFFSNRFEVPSQAVTGTIPPPTESFSDYRIAWKELFSVSDKRKFQRTEHFVREWTRKGPLDNCLGKKGQPSQFVEVSISEVIIVCQIPWGLHRTSSVLIPSPVPSYSLFAPFWWLLTRDQLDRRQTGGLQRVTSYGTTMSQHGASAGIRITLIKSISSKCIQKMTVTTETDAMISGSAPQAIHRQRFQTSVDGSRRNR